MKRVLSILLIGNLLFAPAAGYANSVDVSNEASDAVLLQECVEQFFYSFENMNETADVSEQMEQITDLSDTDTVSTYHMADVAISAQAESATCSEPTYLEMVELLLQRREMIANASEADLTEYQKVLDISVEDISMDGTSASVEVSVLKRWYYSFSPDMESAARDFYTVNLEKENGTWKITNVSGLAESIMDPALAEMGDEITSLEKEAYLNSVEEELAQSAAVLENDVQMMAEESSGTSAAVPASSTYNASAAVAYALQYAIIPNSAYVDFTNLGGDCMNFISQCLYAGGIVQHVGTVYTDTCWFYQSSTNRSASWTGASEFRNYITSSASKINMTSSSWSGVVPGDIIQLMNSGSAYHSLIVSNLAYNANGRSDLLVCAHTTNRQNVSLTQYYATSPTKVYYHINGSK